MHPTKPRAWLVALLAAGGGASALAVHLPSQDHHSRQHHELATRHAQQNNLESRTSARVHDLFLGTCRSLCTKVFEEGTWEYDHCADGCYHDHPNGDYSSDDSREIFEDGEKENGDKEEMKNEQETQSSLVE